MAKRVGTGAAVVAAALGAGAISASEAVAACGVEANLSVARLGPNGGFYVSGSGNGFCSAPPPAINLVTARISPQNVLLGLAISGSSHTASGACNNGACSITPVFWGYTAPASPLWALVSPGSVCFDANVSASAGGSKTVTRCA